MSAPITIATHMLGDKRVGQIVNAKTLNNDETIQEANHQPGAGTGATGAGGRLRAEITR